MELNHVLEIVQKTDPGKMRARNEDAIAVLPRLGVVVLADGMGGHNAGEIASGMATSFLINEFDRLLSEKPVSIMPAEVAKEETERLLKQLITDVNLAIFQASESNPQYKGMGTTLVVAVFYDNRMMVAHIGDSRLYRMRAGELTQLTKDHSLLQEWIDSGMITPEQALLAARIPLAIVSGAILCIGVAMMIRRQRAVDAATSRGPREAEAQGG